MEVMSIDVVGPWIYGSRVIGNFLRRTQISAIKN